MAFSFPFGRDVNQMIARYAVGYPSDRIKDMMTGVERKVFSTSGSEPGLVDIFVQWSEHYGPGRNIENCLVQLMLCADCPIEDAQIMYPDLGNN